MNEQRRLHQQMRDTYCIGGVALPTSPCDGCGGCRQRQQSRFRGFINRNRYLLPRPLPLPPGVFFPVPRGATKPGGVVYPPGGPGARLGHFPAG